MMTFNAGDWALLGNGKKAHKLVQGYNGVALKCTPYAHHSGTGLSGSADIEQEDLRPAESAYKCKRCILLIERYQK